MGVTDLRDPHIRVLAFFHSFSRMIISLKEHPFLYDMIGRSLKCVVFSSLLEG